MELSPPPFFEHLFLESPWPLVWMLLALGVGLLVVALRRVSVKHLLAALLCLPMALSIMLLAWAVKTNREIVIEKTEQLIGDSQPLNWENLKGKLDPNVRLTGDDEQVWLSGEALLDRIHARLQQYTNMKHTIREIQAQTDQSPFARTLVDLKTAYSSDGNAIPVRSRWLLTWERSAKGEYHVVEIRWLQMQGGAPQRIF